MHFRKKHRRVLRLEDYYRKLYETGHVPWIAPTLTRGIVMKIYPGCVTLRTDTAFIRVYWFRKILPPKVREGDLINVIGDLGSAMAQERYFIKNALLIPKGYANLKRQIYAAAEEYTLKPSAYMTPEGTIKPYGN